MKVTVSAQKDLNATAGEIFAIISDHEGTPNWVKEVGSVRLLQEGNPRNGTGAVREVDFKPRLWTTVQEEIVAYEENKFYQYKIVGGMPGLADHLGEWMIQDLGNGKQSLTWTVSFDFRKYHWFNLILNYFSRSFNKVQHQALQDLETYLAAKKK